MKIAATICFSLLTLSLVACTPHASVDQEHPTLSQIESMNSRQFTEKSTKSNSIRLAALRDTAMGYAAQQALAERSDQINALLNKQAKQLDHVFNFSNIMLDHHVVPPVLEVGNNALRLDGAQTIRISDKNYKILKQAHFATVSPSWRDYLWMNFTKPAKPDITLLPKNHAEQAYWKKYSAQGWHNGLSQANQILDQNLGRLKRDYEGMVLYHELLARHMVSQPYVAKTEMGITGGGDHMNIHDQLLRITALPGLNVETSKWKTALRYDDDNS
ncbi:MAG: type IV secretion system protein DotC [marine bacterium B5-7]|nr:MAG: type IV secretion system protein DotC [marine bacterium B5-7]